MAPDMMQWEPNTTSVAFLLMFNLKLIMCKQSDKLKLRGILKTTGYTLQKNFVFRDNDKTEKIYFILKDWILEFKKLLESMFWKW